MTALSTENRLTVVYRDPFLAYELFKNVSILGYLLLAYPLLHTGTDWFPLELCNGSVVA